MLNFKQKKKRQQNMKNKMLYFVDMSNVNVLICLIAVYK